ncbi:MAG: DUF1844 domain-containing protein [Deltaproteobacteria bacterium]|nr:DUF1844 domain-containing protein [Deltaproteobacteria bacterium]
MSENGDQVTKSATDGTGCEESLHQGGVDFSTFVLSLGTSVLVHLGVGEEEGEGESAEKRINLPLARHVIDILAMLKDKTAGNLEEDEEKLVDQLLFDLRLKFVEACNAQGSHTQGSHTQGSQTQEDKE